MALLVVVTHLWFFAYQVDISATMEKGVFDIGGDKTTYDLCVSVDVCPGVFHRTKQITIQPRFCLVNCLDVDLCVKQDGKSMDPKITSLYPPWPLLMVFCGMSHLQKPVMTRRYG